MTRGSESFVHENLNAEGSAISRFKNFLETLFIIIINFNYV